MKRSIASIYERLAGLPGGRWVFTRAVCLKAPYFGSIAPAITSLEPGRCEVRIRDRRRVHNHLGTVHAIAMCNMAELAAGMMTEVTIPESARWIPRGMTVEYLAKARGDLRGVATLDALPEFGEALDLPVEVDILDRDDTRVMRAVITMRVSPNPGRAGAPKAVADAPA
jgi:acyl-coenzyme A thioesterase PaaI-like protein